MSNLIGRKFRNKKYGFTRVVIVDHTGKNPAIPVDQDERIIYFIGVGESIDAIRPGSMTWALFKQVFEPLEEIEPDEHDNPPRL